MLISFSPSVRTVDTGSLKRKSVREKERQDGRRRPAVSACAEKFFEYKTNAGGAARAVPRERGPGLKKKLRLFLSILLVGTDDLW